MSLTVDVTGEPSGAMMTGDDAPATLVRGPAVPSSGMLIRPLRHDDREPIRRLLLDTDVFTPDEITIALELIDIVLGTPGQHDYIINACESGSDVAGYYCIGPTPATQATFDLYWIAVHPSRHGQGIGKALNAHAEELALSRGGRLIIAETSSQPKYEKTRRFYASCGYIEVARIREYYRVGDDLVVFGKYLSTTY